MVAHNETICVLDRMYVEETLRLLWAAAKKERRSPVLYDRFKKSIKILEELKLQITEAS